MSLLTSLVARYKLNEAAGADALDDIGGHTATAVNSPGASGGMRDYESSSSQYHTVADHADFSFADQDLTLVCWPTLESKAASMSLISKWNTSSQREYELLYFITSDRYQFIISADGSAIAATAEANNHGSPATAALTMVTASHDPIANHVRIQVNNGTANTTSVSGGLRNGTSDFRIGARSTAGVYYDGLMKDVLVYRRRLSDFERTILYNSGTPLDYDQYGLHGSFFISTGTDDGTSGTGSGYNNNGSGVRVGGYFGTANFWLRFAGTDIPERATIVTANVTGNVTTSTGSGAKFKWYGVKQVGPTYPTDGTDFDSRPLTTASLAQTRSGSGAYTSGSLVSVLQEIVDQSGFDGTIMLYAKDDGSNATYGGSENHLVFRSFENLTDLMTLNVSWTDPSGVNGSKNLLLMGVG